MFAWGRRAAECCGRDPGASIGGSSVGGGTKGFEGSCPHATSRAEAVGAEQWFS